MSTPSEHLKEYLKGPDLIRPNVHKGKTQSKAADPPIVLHNLTHICHLCNSFTVITAFIMSIIGLDPWSKVNIVEEGSPRIAFGSYNVYGQKMRRADGNFGNLGKVREEDLRRNLMLEEFNRHKVSNIRMTMKVCYYDGGAYNQTPFLKG